MRSKPAYACVYSATTTRAETAPRHERGPVLAVTADVVIFGCQRCGCIFWEPVPPEKKLDRTRCHGYTKAGKRCKLEPEPGSLFCPTHRDQANPEILGAVWGKKAGKPDP